MTAPRLLLVDGHSMAFRAFFALPADNFRTAGGLYTNAIHGFLTMLLKLITDERPTHLAVAFDTHAPTFRKERYDAYKEGRDETPEPFIGQVDTIAQALKAMNVTVVERDGYEADDLLATLAQTGKAAGAQVLVVSGDRDTFQLVDEDVTVLYPVRGVSVLDRMTPEAVEEKFGVPPHLHPHLTALVGEKSDNLPGVPGVGPKTAAKWINQYGSLDAILANQDEIKGKVGQNLRDHVDDVLRNQELNRLLTDVEVPGVSEAGDVDAQMAAMALRPVDREKVNELFDTLEFTTVRKRVFEVFEAEGADEAAEQAAKYELTVRAAGAVEGGLKAWLDARVAGGDSGAGAGAARTGIFVDGVGTPGKGADAEGIALADGEGDAVWCDFAALSAQDEAALRSWLEDPDASKVAHDAKAAWHALDSRGIDLAGVVVDTELAAYLNLPDQRRYDVADLVERFVGRALPESEAAAAGELDLGALTGAGGADDVPERARSFAAQADALLPLAVAFEKQLADIEGTALLTDIEMPVQRVLAQMEHDGIAVDDAHFAQLEAEFDGRVRDAQELAYAALRDEGIDRAVNLSSPKQLQVVLFDELGMPKTKKTKTGYTTDAESLQDLFVRRRHPFLQHLLEHRDAIKMRQMVEGLRRFVQDDQRIHTNFRQTVAATGRLASADPNLQNIPQRTEEGRRIRGGFTVAEGYDALMTADYSQIEMRIMAHLSGDEGLVESFRSGEDLHRFVASRVFDIPLAEVSADDRSRVKAVSYGLAYGLSAYGLGRQLRIDVPEAQRLMDGYFERFGGVRDYLHDVVVQATKDGYTQTIMGRRRYLPDLTSPNRQRRENARRMALNSPIQGSAADIMKIAMLRVAEGLAEAGVRSRMLLQVHDELVLEVVDSEREQVERIVREAMGGAIELSVPLDVSVGFGKTWLDAAH